MFFNQEKSKQEEFVKRTKKLEKELALLLQKHGLVIGSRPVITPDGRIGAQTIYFDANEFKEMKKQAEEQKSEVISE